MAAYYDITAIPSASDIDYRNADEVCGYQLLLCKIFERAGGFDLPLKTNATIREVQRQGALWLREVKPLIADILSAPISGKPAPVCSLSAPVEGKIEAQPASRITLSAIPVLLDSYDLLYRVCNGCPCYDYLREVKLKTVNRWLKGDKSISDTDVVLLLLSETDRDIRSLEKRYTDYAFSILGKWIDELTKYGRFINTPLTEAYKRLVYLLNDDLFAYLGRKDKQDTAKVAWTNTYVLQDHTSLDTRTLLRYIGFLLTANICGYYANEPQDELYCRLWTDYIARPDVHPFFRQALSLDLAKFALA